MPAKQSARRSRKGAPLLYDWRRVRTVMGKPKSNSDDPEWVEPFTFYRARVTPETILNAMRVRGSWHWALIHHSDAHTVVEGGVTGTLTEAKHLAEACAIPFDNRPRVWERTDGAGKPAGESEPVPF